MNDGNIFPTEDKKKPGRKKANTDYPVLRDRLKELREYRNQSISQAAEFIGVSRKMYINWTSGKAAGVGQIYSTPSLEYLIKIANAYHVTLDYLLGLTDWSTPERDYIGKATGLSDKALKGLQFIRPYEDDYSAVLDTINFLLENVVTGDTIRLLSTLYKCFQLDYNIPVYYDGSGLREFPTSSDAEKVYNNRITLAKSKDNLDDNIRFAVDETLLETVLMNKLRDAIRELRKTFTAE